HDHQSKNQERTAHARAKSRIHKASGSPAWRIVGGGMRGLERAPSFLCYPKREMSLRSRHPRNPGAFGLFGLAALPVACTAPAQVATIAPKLSPVSRMYFVRAGTFEVWQDTTRLGTEFYSMYLTGKRDSVITTSNVVYDLRSGPRLMHYEKKTLRINSALDNHLYQYQSGEQIGQQDRALSVTTFDTTATIYHENGGQGDGTVIAIPMGRVYVLDPSVYEQVEALTRDFAESQVPSRTIHAMIPSRDTVITGQMERGPN